MVIKYNLKTQAEQNVSQHFKVKEFRSYSNTYNKLYSNDVLISQELIAKLELLRQKLNCTVTIINGYRCKAHNQAVGGSKSSTHLFGYAADIRCLDAKSGPISGKLVCCKAQDLGFSGIGYMRNNSVHVDVSPSRKWYGDETKKENGTYYSLTKHGTDFYSYFGIKKVAEVTVNNPVNNVNNNEPKEYAAESWGKAISDGITDGTNPSKPITREQAITLCMRKKVNKSYTVLQACNYAYEQGYTDGTLLDRNATKEQCCTFINRIILGDSRATIEDSVTICKEKGIIQGDEKGSLNLKSECSRQDFIVMLYRAVNVSI